MIRGAIGDTGIAYRVDGPADGPVVVFSNSLGTDHRLWDSQMPAVGDRFRVVRYEACGHGLSDPPRGRVTIQRLGQDLIALLDHLEIDRAIVCGCSLGGVIALWLSANRPERVTGVTTTSPRAIARPAPGVTCRSTRGWIACRTRRCLHSIVWAPTSLP